ncbi:tRNA methyl transferase PRC-barrel domain-containing protein, partial [Kaistella sp.]|uniref:tRNA methyl transferase PRC-barrel domain-containing protein n=1 Tax=Kaistella sp. TaxID=2782235 RepID=UPI002F94E1C3
MITKGQLVEIPEHSPLYRRKKPLFTSREEELRWESQVPHYSLFDGFLVGDHPGTEHYKLGQRKGINVGGKKAPLYVIAIDHTENRVFVGGGKDHPALWRKVLTFNPEQLEGMQGFKFTQGEMENGIP